MDLSSLITLATIVFSLLKMTSGLKMTSELKIFFRNWPQTDLI